MGKNIDNFTKLQVRLWMAGASLLLAAVLLGNATYAWFSVSTAPEVKEMKVSMQTTSNFEIALCTDEGTYPESTTYNDGDDYTKWGETVMFENAAELQLPATTMNGQLETVLYSESKRTAGLDQISDIEAQGDGITYYKYKDKICAAVFTVWLRTNTTGDVTATYESTGATLTGEDGESVVNVAIQFGDQDATSGNGGTVDCGTLTASDEPTLCRIMVFIDGEHVRAIDVGPEGLFEAQEVSFDLKFTNSNVQEED